MQDPLPRPPGGDFFVPETTFWHCFTANCKIFSAKFPQFRKILYICNRKEVTKMLELLGIIILVYAIVKIAPKGAGAGFSFNRHHRR